VIQQRPCSHAAHATIYKLESQVLGQITRNTDTAGGIRGEDDDAATDGVYIARIPGLSSPGRSISISKKICIPSSSLFALVNYHTM
jgi:hypothetical protein